METHLAGAGSPPSPLLERCLATLRERERELRVRGVLHAGVFGSVARGEDHERSDIDVMVELNPEHRVGVYEFVGIELFLEDLFHRKVDVVERRTIRRRFGMPIDGEVKVAF
jgi:hypothetical protein